MVTSEILSLGNSEIYITNIDAILYKISKNISSCLTETTLWPASPRSAHPGLWNSPVYSVSELVYSDSTLRSCGHMVGVLLHLISLSIMSASSLLQMTGLPSVLRLNSIPLCYYVYLIFIVQLSTDGHLGCFWDLPSSLRTEVEPIRER